jgi:hypothetical protein
MCIRHHTHRSMESVTERGTTVPPKKKTTHNLPKTPPHQISHHRWTVPGIDPIGSRHPWIQNTDLKPSCHRTGTTTVTWPTQKVTYVIPGSKSSPQESDPTKRVRTTFPKQRQPRRLSQQWVRTSTHWPQSGGTRPSIPPPFHWC